MTPFGCYNRQEFVHLPIASPQKSIFADQEGSLPYPEIKHIHKLQPTPYHPLQSYQPHNPNKKPKNTDNSPTTPKNPQEPYTHRITVQLNQSIYIHIILYAIYIQATQEYTHLITPQPKKILKNHIHIKEKTVPTKPKHIYYMQ